MTCAIAQAPKVIKIKLEFIPTTQNQDRRAQSLSRNSPAPRHNANGPVECRRAVRNPVPATPAPYPSLTPTSFPTVAVGDRVWLDASGNGKQDPGETGVSGVTVTLRIWNGFDDFVTLATTRAGGTGLSLFDGLL